MEYENCEKVKNSTQSIAVYIHETLFYKIITSSRTWNNAITKKKLSLAISSIIREKLNLVVLYQSPKWYACWKINAVFKNLMNSMYSHQVLIGDFNWKDIDWNYFTSTSPDDYAFTEAVRGSYLTQHIKTGLEEEALTNCQH